MRVALQKMVKPVHSAADSEHRPEPAQPFRTDGVAVTGAHLTAPGGLHERGHSLPIAGVSGVELLATIPHGGVGQRIDLIDGAADGGQAPGEERGLDRVGVGGQVARGAEAAEGLPQETPSLDAQRSAQVLAVLDDLVGAEVREQTRRGSRVAPGIGPIDRGGQPRTALVEQQDSMVLQKRAEPAQAGVGRRTRSLAARTALKEEQRRPGQRVRGGFGGPGGFVQADLTGVDADGGAAVRETVAGTRAVERNPKAVVTSEKPRSRAGPGTGGEGGRGRSRHNGHGFTLNHCDSLQTTAVHHHQ